MAGVRKEKEFADLIAQFGRLLRSAVMRVCPPELAAEVDDIEQEARSKLWAVVSAERKISHPASYIHKLGVNAALDAVRRARTRRATAQVRLDDERIAAPGSPVEETDRRLLLNAVNEHLQTLPKDDRRAVMLHLRGLTTTEIGALLKWTEAKARNRVYRQLRALREALARSGIDYEID